MRGSRRGVVAWAVVLALVVAASSSCGRLGALRRERSRHELRAARRPRPASRPAPSRRHRGALERERRRPLRRLAALRRGRPDGKRRSRTWSTRRRTRARWPRSERRTARCSGSARSAARCRPTCGQTYGISSTPVLDRGRNRLYVIGADGLLYALDLSTGTTVPGWPVRIIERKRRGVRVGRPRDARNTGLCAGRELLRQGQRRTASSPTAGSSPSTSSTRRIVATFDVVPGPNNMGGIWGYAGISIDPATGHLWTATGNSWVFDPDCGCIVEDVDYGESLVELDPDLNVIAATALRASRTSRTTTSAPRLCSSSRPVAHHWPPLTRRTA